MSKDLQPTQFISSRLARVERILKERGHSHPILTPGERALIEAVHDQRERLSPMACVWLAALIAERLPSSVLVALVAEEADRKARTTLRFGMATDLEDAQACVLADFTTAVARDLARNFNARAKRYEDA